MIARSLPMAIQGKWVDPAWRDTLLRVLNQDPWGSVMIYEGLRLGRIEVVAFSDHALVMANRSNRIVSLAGTSPEQISLLLDTVKIGADIAVGPIALADRLSEKFGLARAVPCIQVVYPHAEVKVPDSDLVCTPATLDDVDFIMAHYQMETEEIIREYTVAGSIIIGRVGGDRVGFIGEHSEASMGILHVLEAYRGRGFAQMLELHMMRRFLNQGRIPFAHIVVDNIASLRLQAKLGMVQAPGKIVWVVPDDEA